MLKKGLPLPTRKAGMLSSVKPIQFAVRDAHSWWIEKNAAGVTLFHPTYFGIDQLDNPSYNAAEFYGETGPALQEWIEEQLQFTGRLTLTTSSIHALHAFWNAECTLVEPDGYIVGHPVRIDLTGIGEVSLVERVNDGLRLMGRLYALSLSPSGKPYSNHSYDGMIVLKTAWLDEHYPNWKGMLDAGELVNLHGNKLAQLVFGKGDYAKEAELARGPVFPTIDLT